MSRKQQFSITASSLTFHNPPRVGEFLFYFIYHQLSSVCPEESVCPGFWYHRSTKHGTGSFAPATTRADMEHGGTDRRVKWTGAEADRWKPRWLGIGGWEKTRNRSLILCSMNTPEFLMSSPSQASKSRSKQQTSLLFSCFQPLCRSPLKFTGEVFKQATGSQAH